MKPRFIWKTTPCCCVPGFVVLLALPGILVAQSGAIPAQTLHEHCRAYIQDPQSDDGLLCLAYVEGFLRGVTFSSYAGPLTSEEPESWTDRAVRTRLGERALARASACRVWMPRLDEFVFKLVADIDSMATVPEYDAHQLVQNTLLNHYGCVTTEEGKSTR